LYELFKGEPPFQDRFELARYYYNDDWDPQHALETSVLGPQRNLSQEQQRHLRSCWHCLRDLPAIDGSIISDQYSPSLESHAAEINRMLKRVLSREGRNRPRLEQVEMHAAANTVRCRIRDDEVVLTGDRTDMIELQSVCHFYHDSSQKRCPQSQ